MKYGKLFWVIEMVNWYVGDGVVVIDLVDKQIVQMIEMVRLCEECVDVFCYVWFIGWGGVDLNSWFIILFGVDGELIVLGCYYLGLFFVQC